MTPGMVTAGRWSLVALYTFGAWLAFLGGISEADLVALVIVGVICLVTILSADWVAGGVRRVDPMHLTNCAVTRGEPCDCGR